MILGGKSEAVAATAGALETASLFVTGNSAHQFSIWSVESVQFTNAYRYCMLRAGRRIEGSICPSENQTLLSCAWNSILRVFLRMLGIEVDSNVSLLEYRGLPLIGELGFIFQEHGRRRGHTKVESTLWFSVPERTLVLADLPGILRCLPELPWANNPSDYPPPSRLFVELSSVRLYLLLSQ